MLCEDTLRNCRFRQNLEYLPVTVTMSSVLLKSFGGFRCTYVTDDVIAKLAYDVKFSKTEGICRKFRHIELNRVNFFNSV